MARTLEFYFDYGSPYSYLADTQVEAIAQRAGATLVRKPMLLGGVFKATGNHSPAELPQKSAWSAFDMPMWARHYGVPFQRNPFFPVNTLALMRGAAAAQIDGSFERYHPAVFKAMWVEGRNLNDMKEVAAVLTAAGLDVGKFGARIQDQDVKDRLKATTEEAVARGVFGAPTCFVDKMMFFGNDRLPFVELALKEELK
ncbi:2-hydroxychromene-2-carboxylate isomerase [Reyranella sp.]|jgi:2-hydroxychromene-2-carboxylate isomerase|uniref:2-hydroxychromene-2-carboxylate isomerase n=1 Tax=Reyranella sp. TaxID=1929291 RepID=UPI000BD68B36|nr:2-hydroxychromene-2-carboxylate isomerase [Reyranella sp.]OYY38308.1 MAG: disulfide bond formation protein DsbA [Rhodospirillales bacterium 35-66-84]OYZ92051.1 MAG: disulfide bond formation protein DsbA [Rhodospirillales bacterium 24-66-33]OZB23414.1 MAG: disulfide bond formation protein DsbA [Rhodospirillales bacterium 39-66-50]HQS17715.1 2-hydroxychromene-2-carboxylate isomerase [Reyranella sp.]HQT14439.1 2-hydroxychromene-2-carboxylate isomerase [Reyranella sp.]